MKELKKKIKELKLMIQKKIRHPLVIALITVSIIIFSTFLLQLPKPSNLSITFDRSIYDIFDNITFRLVNNGDIEAITKIEKNSSVNIAGKCFSEAETFDIYPEINCEDRYGKLVDLTKYEFEQITILGRSSSSCKLRLNVKAIIKDIDPACDFAIDKLVLTIAYSDISNQQLKKTSSSVDIAGRLKGFLRIENNTVFPIQR